MDAKSLGDGSGAEGAAIEEVKTNTTTKTEKETGRKIEDGMAVKPAVDSPVDGAEQLLRKPSIPTATVTPAGAETPPKLSAHAHG